MKRFLLLTLSFALLIALAAPAFAAGEGYSDVPADAWYAGAVAALKEQGLMEGMGDGRFAPGNAFTRAQLAMVLFRMAGCPKTEEEDEFTDTQPGMWYSEAIAWAAKYHVVEGYGNGRYGTNDPVTQEQAAVMLWRDAGSYYLGKEYSVDDGVEHIASSWAADGVRWARVEGLFTDAVEFSPKKAASRAQVADMVYRYMQLKEKFASDAVSGATVKPAKAPKAAVIYFSCTGATEKIAENIADSLGADICRIVPAVPYTDEDLNWNSDSSRTTKEQNDPAARPQIANEVTGLDDCDIVFLGYPIWHGQAPKIMYTFVEKYDLSGKTVVPFCTSGSSPIGSSAVNLSAVSAGEWLSGRRFRAGASRESVTDWINTLGLDLEAK